MVCTTARLQVLATLDEVASPKDCCRVCQASTARCTVCGGLAEGQCKRGGWTALGAALFKPKLYVATIHRRNN